MSVYIYTTIRTLAGWGVVMLLLVFTACGVEKPFENSLTVTATAYNSLPEQTNERPSLTAWGETLTPGDKAIAVSRDLIPMGLDHGTEVRIEGLPGTFRVVDKLPARWSKRIDIYMGKNLDEAREWGKQQVEIYWPSEVVD